MEKVYSKILKIYYHVEQNNALNFRMKEAIILSNFNLIKLTKSLSFL